METMIGLVTSVFDQGNVAVFSLIHRLELSDTIHILGQRTDFYQRVLSFEVDHRKVLAAQPGTEVYLTMTEPVQTGDRVLLVPKEEIALDDFVS